MASLPVDADVASRHEDGSPAVVMLEGRHVVDGIACVQMIHLHENGRLAYCVLDEPRNVGDFDLAPHDSMHLRADGSLEQIHFEHARDVLGQAGVRSVGFNERGEVEDMIIGDMTVDPRGIVRRRRLAATTTIAGIPCAKFATFDPEARLVGTVLGDDLMTPHGVIPAGSTVTFHPDGSVDRAQISRACLLGGQRFERNDPAHFLADTVEKEGWVFYTPSSEREGEADRT